MQVGAYMREHFGHSHPFGVIDAMVAGENLGGDKSGLHIGHPPVDPHKQLSIIKYLL